MIRGTTPTHIIGTDVDLRTATAIYVTYSQREAIILEKEKTDMTVEEDKLNIPLSQADTLLFDDKAEVLVQIRAKFLDGTAIASNLMRTSAKKILKDGEI